MLKKIIAQKVRAAVEELEDKFFLEPCGTGLACLCAVASAALSQAFLKNGFNNILVYGEYRGQAHCWVKTEDGRNWDLTATQFGPSFPKVYSFLKNRNFEEIEYVAEPYKKYFSDWPVEQRPGARKTKKILREAGL